jgi:PAS domain S-box-containing protein
MKGRTDPLTRKGKKAGQNETCAEAFPQAIIDMQSPLFQSRAILAVASTLEEGTILNASDAFLTTLGYSRQEVVGKTSSQLNLWLNPMDRIQAVYQGLRDGHLNSFESRIRAKNGDIREVVFSSDVYLTEKKPYIVTVMIDVTQRKKTEGERVRHQQWLEKEFIERTWALRQANEQVMAGLFDRIKTVEALGLSEVRFRDLVESLNEVIYELRVDGTFSYCSPIVENLLQYQAPEFLGHSFIQFIHADDQSWVKERFRAHLLGKDGTLDCRLLAKDGTVKWVRNSSRLIYKDGVPVGVRGVLMDITPQKRIELAINEMIAAGAARSSEEFFASIVTSLSAVLEADCVLIGKLCANQESIRTLAFSRDGRLAENIEYSLEGSPCENVINGTPCIYPRHVAQSFPKNVLLKELKAEGYAGLRLSDRKGNPLGLIVTLFRRPLTEPEFITRILQLFCSRVAGEMERREIEKQEERHRQQLMRSEHLVALGMWVAGVAHEINNPNHFIMTNASLIADAWNDAQPVFEQYVAENGKFLMGGLEYPTQKETLTSFSRGIIEGARRIERLVTELKAFARDEKSGFIEWVDMNAVAESALTLTANLTRLATAHVITQYRPNLPRVQGCFQRLEQVLINLIQNACQALTNNHQAIRVVTDYDSATGLVICRIHDEGRGIAPEHRVRVFEPFFTTRRDQGGLGLGLSISARIIEDHGGALSLSSELNQGTFITIALPACNKEPL